MAALVQHLGTGRRKRAVARVFLRSGKGDITVNGRTFENYFPSEASRAIVRQPLLATETADKFDVMITTAGGGPTGQAGAAKLGIARALLGVQHRAARQAEGTRIFCAGMLASMSARSTARRAPASGSSSRSASFAVQYWAGLLPRPPPT